MSRPTVSRIMAIVSKQGQYPTCLLAASALLTMALLTMALLTMALLQVPYSLWLYLL